MTNKEKYAKEILDIVCETAESPALVKGKLVACTEVGGCVGCKFSDLPDGCGKGFEKWAQEEYKAPEVDWTKIPENTRILVRDREDNPWFNAHFAYYRNGHVFAFPYGRTSWTITPEMIICPWEYAEIADPEDWEKYLKYE